MSFPGLTLPEGDTLYYAQHLTPDVENALTLAAFRTKIHNHDPFGRCDNCLRDVMELGRYGYVMLDMIRLLREEAAELMRRNDEQAKELEYWSNR